MCYIEIFAHTKKTSRPQVEKCCFSRNRNKSQFKLAWTLKFTVINSRKFQTWWFFLNAFAGHMWPVGR